MQPRAVLYVVPTASIGGAETFVRMTAARHSRDFTPIYCVLRSGALVEQLRQHGRTVEGAPFIVRLSRPWSVLRAIAWIGRIARQHQVELVHSSMAYGALLGAPAAFLSGAKHLWFQHGPVSGWMDRLALWLSRNVIVNSEYTRTKQGRLGRGKYFLLTLGVEGRSSAHSTNERLRIGMLTRYQEGKGIELFLDAVRKLNQTHPGKFEAVLWGGPTEAPGSMDYAKNVSEACARVNVRQAGPVRDFTELSGVDILVNASIYPEAFGLSIIEAMWIGAVPIAPDEGGPKEIIRSKENGLLFQPRNADDLASKLAQLIDDGNLLEKIRAVGTRDAREKFSAERMMRDLEKIYLEVLATRSKRPWAMRSQVK